MKYPRCLAILVVLSATAALAGDFCEESRRARRQATNDPLNAQEPSHTALAEEGPAAQSESAGPVSPFSGPAPKVGPTAGPAGAGSRLGGFTAARGAPISTAKQRATREIRILIRRLR